jgi:hypothetical protein
LVFQLVVLIHVIKLNIKKYIKKIKIVKSVKFQVISGVVSYKSGLIYRILKGMNTFLYGVFASPHGGPPSFLAC